MHRHVITLIIEGRLYRQKSTESIRMRHRKCAENRKRLKNMPKEMHVEEKTHKFKRQAIKQDRSSRI